MERKFEVIATEPNLVLRVTVASNGEAKYREEFQHDDQEAITRVCTELAELTGQSLSDVESEVVNEVLAERRRWLRERGMNEDETENGPLDPRTAAARFTPIGLPEPGKD